MVRSRLARSCAFLLAAGALLGTALPCRALLAQSIEPQQLAAVTARAIGPAAPGGRIVDLAVPSGRPWELYVAAASGGLWKSTNNGTTWSCVFAQSLSIGAIAVAPSDPDVIWVGTGEGNNQRSSYAGNGVWRSTDGGKSFTNVGLPESHHIGRIVVHPTDAATAWVAVLGHLYTKNGERGLYRTQDGGASWELVLGRGDAVGVVDVVIDPREPDTLFAASYQRLRRAWNFDDVGDAAIYRSRDGGDSWTRLAGGLPSGRIGRIGLAFSAAEPGWLYACIDEQNEIEVPAAKEGEAATKRPAGGGVWRSADGGATWEKRNEKPVSGEPPYYYGQIRVDPHDPDHVWVLGIEVFVSKDGGKTFASDVAGSLHSDHHALWFDPHSRGRIVLGNDGGLAQSYDGGASFDWYSNLSLAQFYTVSVDRRRPYRVYGGLQDNGVWMGPSRARGFGGSTNSDWRFIGGGDGMYVLSDPADPDTVYLESQFGALSRTNVRRGETAWIQPRGAEGEKERFNWCSPLLLSSHNSQVVYFGSQRLWRSLDRGDHWKALSGDLTTNDPAKTAGNVPHCTLTSISESPLDPDLLLVGSDDGRVQWSRDGGRTFESLESRLPGVPPALWVSRVELSPHDRAVAWVTVNGYREDDFTPYVFRTSDGGATFEAIANGLPDGPVNVIHESPRRAGVLFLGSDAGAFFSIDRGDHWQPLASDLPLNSVLDLAVHPRDPEVVVSTHGRGLFVVEVTAHEQLTAESLAAPAALFAPAPATLWRGGFGGGIGWSGDRNYRAANPPPGAPLWLWMADATKEAKVEIVDAAGKVVRTIAVAEQAGLQRVAWDLQLDPPQKPAEAKPVDAKADEQPLEPKPTPRASRQRRRYEPLPESAEVDPSEFDEPIEAPFAQDAGGGGRRRGRGGSSATPGRYTVRLSAAGVVSEQPLEVVADPGPEGG
ncbi:MAG: hypothetical protein JNL90_04955 [Planctomycetes bacterium]|nr:hypothetical protein [Planctomycetota bacterium]